MKERTVQIHFRVTEKERREFQNRALNCGLTLSEYLRKLATGYEPKSLPPIEYGEMVSVLSNLYSEFQRRGNKSAEEKILQLVTRLTEAISPDTGRLSGSPQSKLCGEKEQPRSGEPFAACGESYEGRVLRRGDDENLAGS